MEMITGGAREEIIGEIIEITEVKKGITTAMADGTNMIIRGMKSLLPISFSERSLSQFHHNIKLLLFKIPHTTMITHITISDDPITLILLSHRREGNSV